jgi:hypothetical protein
MVLVSPGVSSAITSAIGWGYAPIIILNTSCCLSAELNLRYSSNDVTDAVTESVELLVVSWEVVHFRVIVQASPVFVAIRSGPYGTGDGVDGRGRRARAHGCVI